VCPTCAFAQKVGTSGKFVAARTSRVNVSNRGLNAVAMDESFCDFCQVLDAYEWVIGTPVFCSVLFCSVLPTVCN